MQDVSPYFRLLCMLRSQELKPRFIFNFLTAYAASIEGRLNLRSDYYCYIVLAADANYIGEQIQLEDFHLYNASFFPCCFSQRLTHIEPFFVPLFINHA